MEALSRSRFILSRLTQRLFLFSRQRPGLRD